MGLQSASLQTHKIHLFVDSEQSSNPSRHSEVRSFHEGIEVEAEVAPQRESGFRRGQGPYTVSSLFESLEFECAEQQPVVSGLGNSQVLGQWRVQALAVIHGAT